MRVEISHGSFTAAVKAVLPHTARPKDSVTLSQVLVEPQADHLRLTATGAGTTAIARARFIPDAPVDLVGDVPVFLVDPAPMVAALVVMGEACVSVAVTVERTQLLMADESGGLFAGRSVRLPIVRDVDDFDGVPGLVGSLTDVVPGPPLRQQGPMLHSEYVARFLRSAKAMGHSSFDFVRATPSAALVAAGDDFLGLLPLLGRNEGELAAFKGAWDEWRQELPRKAPRGLAMSGASS